MNTDSVVRIMGFTFLFLCALGAGAIVGYQVISKVPPDAGLLGIVGTVLGFVIHNVGFTQGAKTTNETISENGGNVSNGSTQGNTTPVSNP